MSSDEVRVLCIAGSPRRGGNSDRLLDACVEGILRAGGTPDILAAATANVATCRGCHTCSSTGTCVIEDAMGDIYERLDVADAVLVAAPIYFAGVPAVLKVLYDRCQPYWARRYVLGEDSPRARPGGLILVRAGGDPFGFEGAVMTTKSVFHVLGVRLSETLYVEGPDAAGEVDSHDEELEEAARIGHRIVDAVRHGRG